MSTNSQPVIASFTFHSPLGEAYNETRSDCDASIAGAGTTDLVITEVIKPIVWFALTGESKKIVQQAVVVVESQSTAPTADEESSAATGVVEPVMVPGSSYTFKTAAETEKTEVKNQPASATGEQAPETSPQTPA